MSDKISIDDMKAEDWDGEMGDKWLTHIEQFEGMIAPVGQALVAKAAPQKGEDIIDIGCGSGVNSFDLLRAMEGTGSVTGLDISSKLVAEAQRRAASLGADNATFIVGDAGRVKIPGEGFDHLFSRFGIMFFDQPYDAFANMHSFLKPDGRVTFACWASPKDNAWVSELMAITAKYVELPAPVPRAPGPFALAEPDYTEDLMAKGGFKNISIEPWSGQQMVGGRNATPESAARFMMEALFMGDMLAEEPEEVRAKAEKDTIDFFRQYATSEGIPLPCKVWFVTAKA